MDVHDYARHDAVGLAAPIRQGQVGAAEVESAAREALTLAHARLNALTGPLLEAPTAYDSRGPLDGVPIRDTPCDGRDGSAGTAYTWQGRPRPPRRQDTDHDDRGQG